MTPESIRSYVSDAELPSSRDLVAFDTEPVTFDPAVDQSIVAGPQVLSFVKGISAARRQAVASCALFASLVADAKASRNEVAAWSALYGEALTKLGWVVQETTTREFDRARVATRVNEAVLDVVGAVAIGGTALALVQVALAAIQKADAGAKWFTLFERQTHRERVSAFQIGLVDGGEGGDFAVKLLVSSASSSAAAQSAYAMV
jgi:hypothetical protein